MQALKKHISGGESDGLGAIFAQKTGSLFADLWSSFSSPFKSVFEAVPPLPLFQSAENKEQQQQEEHPGGGDGGAKDSGASPEKFSTRDLSSRASSRPKHKAALPKFSDRSIISSPKTMRVGVPAGKFKDEIQANKFFSKPREASTAAHTAAYIHVPRYLLSTIYYSYVR